MNCQEHLQQKMQKYAEAMYSTKVIEATAAIAAENSENQQKQQYAQKPKAVATETTESTEAAEYPATENMRTCIYLHSIPATENKKRAALIIFIDIHSVRTDVTVLEQMSDHSTVGTAPPGSMLQPCSPVSAYRRIPEMMQTTAINGLELDHLMSHASVQTANRRRDHTTEINRR